MEIISKLNPMAWQMNNLNWVWIVIFFTWASLLFIGHHHTLHHGLAHTDSLAFGEFGYALLVWMLMAIAMMLPSALPMAQKIVQISELQSNSAQRHQIQAAFLLAYLVIWAGFSVFMVIAQAVSDRTLSFVCEFYQALLNAFVLIEVGLFQFSPLKKACLSGCRSISAFIAQHYQHGWKGGWHIGIQHGLFCLGCCWALMIGCAALGMENLFNMLLFTGMMTLERLWKHGEALSLWIGIGLISLGIGHVVISLPLRLC